VYRESKKPRSFGAVTQISTDINAAALLLQSGEVVAVPTETVYGLAANALDPLAIAKIFAIKQRPLYNPLIVHIGTVQQLSDVAQHIPEMAWELAHAFWPGPLTLVLPKSVEIPDIVTAGQKSVAVRMPNHPMCLELLKTTKFPIAAPSANPFNYISPTSAAHVYNMLQGKVPLILDGGSCIYGIESTILGFSQDKCVIHRHGAIEEEQIASIVGELLSATHSDEMPVAPGMLATHYSPTTPLLCTEHAAESIKQHKGKRIAFLTLSPTSLPYDSVQTFVLSDNSNLQEAASALYATLHQIDALNFDLIIAELVPEQGIGKAINDKLRRANSAR
jgi:L-threonylcarbamoyladenylate synthase